jgi:hypothetical protein
MIVKMNRCREQLPEGVADYDASCTAVIPSDLEMICELRESVFPVGCGFGSQGPKSEHVEPAVGLIIEAHWITMNYEE